MRVREMAASVNLSPARFSHQFARTTGMLPGEFLRTLRRYHGERILALRIMREALLEKHPGDRWLSIGTAPHLQIVIELRHIGNDYGGRRCCVQQRTHRSLELMFGNFW
jgi:AraC-like DNA-binding protein